MDLNPRKNVLPPLKKHSALTHYATAVVRMSTMSSDVPFEYLDTSFGPRSFAVFEEMKATAELCDVSIKVGQNSFSAHRVILAGRIPYFRAMFNSHFQESSKEEIIMESVDPGALQCLISFAYNGKLLITEANVEHLLATSIYLQFTSAASLCFRHLFKHINFRTVLIIRAFAKTAYYVNGIESADRYIADNFEDFSMSDFFLDLPFSVLEQLLHRDDLFVMSEEVVFEAVTRWVKANESDRGVHLPNLLLSVRMCLLGEQFLRADVLTEKLILSSSACKPILDEVKTLLQQHSITEQKNPLSNFRAQERCCEAKQHLKCAKIMGCAMYCICSSADSVQLYYYDFFCAIWVKLCDDLNMRCVSHSYVICKEEMLYFVNKEFSGSFCLKTLERTCVKGKNEMPTDATVVLHNDKVYLFGDYCNPDVADQVQCFRPQQYTLSKAGKMTMKRKYHRAVSLGECIYVTGGIIQERINHFRDDDDERYIDDRDRCTYLCCNPVLSSAEKYDPVTGTSVEISPMLQRRYSHECAVLSGKMYVCGGLLRRPEYRQYSLSSEVYDPLTGEWNRIARIDSEMDPMSLVAYDEKLYVSDISGTLFKEGTVSFHMYDPSVDQWKFDVSSSIPHIYNYITMVTNTAAKLHW